MKDRGTALREDSPRHPWRRKCTEEELADNWARTFGQVGPKPSPKSEATEEALTEPPT